MYYNTPIPIAKIISNTRKKNKIRTEENTGWNGKNSGTEM